LKEAGHEKKRLRVVFFFSAKEKKWRTIDKNACHVKAKKKEKGEKKGGGG